MGAEELNEHLQGFLVWAVLGCLILSVAYRNDFFKLGDPVYVPIKGLNVIICFLCFLVAQVIVLPAAILVILTLIKGGNLLHTTTIEAGWGNIALIVGGVAAVLLGFLCVPKHQRRLIWGEPKNRFHNIFIGMLAWFVSYPIVAAFGQLLTMLVLLLFGATPVEQTAVQHFRQAVGDPFLTAAATASIITIVPLAEEILFRGLLQTWIKYRLKSPMKGILLTSIIFTAFHFSMSQGISNIPLMGSLLILSFFLGFVYERQRSLWASIGLHSFFNGMSILLILME